MKITSFYTIVFLGILWSGCESYGNRAINTSRTNNVQSAIEIIDKTPLWIDTPVSDMATRRDVLSNMAAICRYDTDDIREAERILISRPRHSREEFKLWVLNRYLFNVPKRVPWALFRPFGGAHVPSDQEGVNWLYPLEINSDGKLMLTGQLQSYLGPGHQTIKEFDYFREVFGIRKIPED